MKKTILAAIVVLSMVHVSADADHATVDGLVAAKVPLTDAQKTELTAQSCPDKFSNKASCDALVEAVAKVAAGLQGNEAAVAAVHNAFAKVHPALAAAAIDRTVALAPSTAVTLAALQLEANPTAAGGLNNAINRVNNTALNVLQRVNQVSQNSLANVGQTISGLVAPAPSSPSQP